MDELKKRIRDLEDKVQTQNQRIAKLELENRVLAEQVIKQIEVYSMDSSAQMIDDELQQYLASFEENEEEEEEEIQSPKKKRKKAIIPAGMTKEMVPECPIQVGVFTLHSLGEITTEENYHSERYIYPIGYKISRMFQSTKQKEQVLYTCSIERGQKGPLFRVKAMDMEDVIGNTPTQCWSVILKQVNIIREKTNSSSVSGPEYFGLTQPIITHWLQNQNKELQKYVKQQILF